MKKATLPLTPPIFEHLSFLASDQILFYMNNLFPLKVDLHSALVYLFQDAEVGLLTYLAATNEQIMPTNDRWAPVNYDYKVDSYYLHAGQYL